jgi:hypothetical protein
MNVLTLSCCFVLDADGHREGGPQLPGHPRAGGTEGVDQSRARAAQRGVSASCVPAWLSSLERASQACASCIACLHLLGIISFPSHKHTIYQRDELRNRNTKMASSRLVASSRDPGVCFVLHRAFASPRPTRPATPGIERQDSEIESDTRRNLSACDCGRPKLAARWP